MQDHDQLPQCSTLTACKQHAGKRVRVVGTYRKTGYRPPRLQDPATVRTARIMFDDGSKGPFLEVAVAHPGCIAASPRGHRSPASG